MTSLTPTDQIRPPILYDNYQHRDTYSYANYGQFWTDSQHRRNLTTDLPLLEERTQAIATLNLFTENISDVIQHKLQSYQERKSTIPYENIQEKDSNDAALDKMAEIFRQDYIPILHNQIKKITIVFPIVQAHFKQFSLIANNSDLRFKREAITLNEDIRETRKKIRKQLVKLKALSRNLDRKMCPTRYKLQTEIFDRYLSVAEGVQHYFRLFINATRVLRNMEQGMAKYLQKQYDIPLDIKEEEPIIVERPDPPQIVETITCNVL